MGHLGGTAFAWVTPFLECPHDHRHPPQKIVGAEAKRFLLGIWKCIELEGVLIRGVHRVQFEVAETMEQVFVGLRFKFY